ncbi:hypothetical protein CC78DRAFT_583209 [Lojkania enalia]|uniref:Peptidase metallopeptidase domain-containing protein n=1 Tax=Lojkania enalia TaxID=147567 RepID=A0A9P4K4T1_9PLEO|nr:hypothetical protein CC78DRAFT_583209 [Didymosphaeria enalia]
MRLHLLFLLCGVVSGFFSPISKPTVTGVVSLIPSTSPTASRTPAPDVSSWQYDKNRQSKHVHDFYKLFGWLKSGDTIRDFEMPRAIRKIQRILHEPETGVYDQKMETVMSRPKCGYVQPYNETDAMANETMSRRYVLWGPKWDRTTITYRFINYTSDIPQDRQRTLVSEALLKWTQYLPISIVPAPSNVRADIHFRFMSMGPGENAYAFTNMISDGLSLASGLVNITFNDDYNWADDRLFNYTAVHEIGHSLGLSHSKVEDAWMWPYYDAKLGPLHPDDQAAVHQLYGWKNPRWKRIDNNSGTKYIVQVSSDPLKTAPLDGIYQLRSSGQVLRHDGTASWISIDNNKDTVQIAGSAGNVYQRHTDGSIYKYTGSGSNWQYISPPSDNTLEIVAAADQLYQRRKDGWAARWSGSGTTWLTIEQPSMSRQIAVTQSKTLWNLLVSGEVVRSYWPYGNGWTIVDVNADNIAIAVGGDEFYKLQSDGKVVWLDMEAYFWHEIENSGSVGIYAAGGYLYSRHRDGSVWRYTGTEFIWEQLDAAATSAGVIGDWKGSVWEIMRSGEVLKLVS